MRKIILYTYQVDEKRFSQTSNLMLKREIVNLESRNEREFTFAVGTYPNMHTRISIASSPGLVYYDRDSASYRVWFDSQDQDGAIEAIGHYILDRVGPEIRMHQSFIKQLQDEQDSAIKLLEQLPSD